MKKIFLSAVTLFLFTGCVTVPEGSYTSLPTSRTFHAGFDRVWGVLVSEISAFAVIKTIDKTSGLITTEPLNMGAGLMSEIVLKKYAHRPPNILGTWDAGRALLSIFANSKGSSTTLRITAHFAGFEANVTHSWMEWPTRGVLENMLLDLIAKDIGVPITGSGQLRELAMKPLQGLAFLPSAPWASSTLKLSMNESPFSRP
jgi:hypothetical protein